MFKVYFQGLVLWSIIGKEDRGISTNEEQEQFTQTIDLIELTGGF